MMATSPQTSPSTTSIVSGPQKDVYDTFIDIYFAADIRVRSVILKRVTTYVGHPVYTHLLRTMDQENCNHVMGYLRSQRCVEMYNILEQITSNSLPVKEDFFRTIDRF
jgi:hypothetical protein